MHFPDWVLICTLALAWYHVGIIWLVQVIAWPLLHTWGETNSKIIISRGGGAFAT